ncbi:ATP-binding cassette domain-containing protein [Oligoflexia bacterium]|nr:ATP-binding cassette domain-containing protein [Oligoflexia bacterium]
MPVISVSDLSKHYQIFSRREGVLGGVKDLFHRDYRTLKAVDQISFTLDQGDILGYIGPNGAGKSTSIKMLTGILKPTSGTMEVLGYDPYVDRKTYTRHIGVVFGQRTQLWWDIAAIESFKLLAKVYQVSKQDYKEKLETLVEILSLADLLHFPARKLSLGQRIRCDLAASLLHSPQILFLDEPTIGLDAIAKHSMRAFLRKINRELHTTIILTTHDLTEIEELCKRVMIVDKGHIIYDGSLDDIKSIPGIGRRIYIDFADTAPLEALNHEFTGRVQFHQEGKRRLVASYDPKQFATVDLIQGVIGNHKVTDLTVTEPSIEEVVIKVYNGGAQ